MTGPRTLVAVAALLLAATAPVAAAAQNPSPDQTAATLIQSGEPERAY